MIQKLEKEARDAMEFGNANHPFIQIFLSAFTLDFFPCETCVRKLFQNRLKHGKSAKIEKFQNQ